MFLSHVLTNYYIPTCQSVSGPFIDSPDFATSRPFVLVNIYILFKIPTMTHSLFVAVLVDTVGAWA